MRVAVPVSGIAGGVIGGWGSEGPAGAQRPGEQCSPSSAAETVGSVCRAASLSHISCQPAERCTLPQTVTAR